MRSLSIKEIESRCKGLEIRPITREDFDKYCPQYKTRNSFKGYMFFIDGDYMGSAGVEYRPDAFYVFSDMVKDDRIKKTTVWRCTKLVIDMIDKLNNITVATSDYNNHRAQAFVIACGFVPYASDKKSIYFYREAKA